MIQDKIVELGSMPWNPTPLEPGYVSHGQLGFDGSDGPEMVRARFPDRAIPPHYHRGAQFQLLIGGALEFQKFTMVAPAVHYTDHNVVYGPFKTAPGHDMIVVHALPAGTQGMLEVRQSAELQAEINPAGREFQRSAHEVAWEALPGGGRRKRLLDAATHGPACDLVELPAGVALDGGMPQFGRYEYIHRGSAQLGDRVLPAETMRFLRADEPVPPLVAGPEGAVVIVMVFDADAARSYGGKFSDPLPLYLFGRKLKHPLPAVA